MLNKLLVAFHWIIYCLVILTIFSVIIVLYETKQVDTVTQNIFRYSILALAIYIIFLRIIKKDWIYFPWQHDKE